MSAEWKQVSTEVIAENPWFKLMKDKVIRPDGTEGEFNYIDLPPSVEVIAINDEGKVCVFEIHRYTTNMKGIEIPAGSPEGDETPLEAAKTELREETGYVAEHWEQVGEFQVSNGQSNQMSTVFIAKGLTEIEGNEQEAEGIYNMRFVSFDEIFEMIRTGEISSAWVIAALMQAMVHLEMIGK